MAPRGSESGKPPAQSGRAGTLSAKSTEVTPNSKLKSSKKAKERNSKKAPGTASVATFKNKVVIRRLPPTLPEAVFWKAVAPWIRDAEDCRQAVPAAEVDPQPVRQPTVDFKQYIHGKVKPDANKQDRHSRAYVRFIDAASLVEFHKAFDGHIFRDSKGHNSIALVEFAPFQRISPVAKGKRKPDPKQGTIETDPDYLAFVQTLEQENAASPEKKSDGELVAHLLAGKEKEKAEAAAKSTPLLEYLRAAKSAKSQATAAAKRARKAEAKAASASASASSTTPPPPKADKGKAKEASTSDKSKKPAKKTGPKPVDKGTKKDTSQKPKQTSAKVKDPNDDSATKQAQPSSVSKTAKPTAKAKENFAATDANPEGKASPNAKSKPSTKKRTKPAVTNTPAPTSANVRHNDGV